MTKFLQKLGPGLLFAGAAIGVSHLVQSTRAGAGFGFGLVWALILINLVKYPFFQFGPRYAMATGESLVRGYKRLGKPALWFYLLLTVTTMFTIQTAVTIVTAGIAATMTGGILSTEIWTLIIIGICLLLLLKGRYGLLDQIIKYVVIILTISTLAAVVIAAINNDENFSWLQVLPESSVGVAFLIAFMGWMPAPLDISVWHSLWAIEKRNENEEFGVKESLFDFNVGYIASVFIGFGFIALGALVMFHTEEELSPLAGVFSGQLISMYTESLGSWSYVIIGVAALTTMFSTTITTLDASPRAVAATLNLINGNDSKKGYLIWILILAVGTIAIFFFMASEMGLLIQIATVISFLTAPFYALANYWLISSRHTPKEWRPSMGMHILSILGIIVLVGFGIWFLLNQA